MTPRIPVRLAVWASLVLFVFDGLGAQESYAERASALINAGRLDQALSVYDSALVRNEEDLTARLGRAHVLAWTQQDALAAVEFDGVLARDPSNLSALLGLGYNHAWHGRYAEASGLFDRAHSVAPDSPDVAKAMAQLALWQGRAREAVQRFGELARSHPEDADLAVGLGQAHLTASEPGAARSAFRRALSMTPGRDDARRGLEASFFSPAKLELSIWGGYTAFNGSGATPVNGENGTGIRTMRLAARPLSNLTVWALVDDGLSLDNPALVTAGDHVPASLGGAILAWGGRYFSKVEVGWRDQNSVGQRMVSAEQVVVLPSPIYLKGGAWLGDREDGQTEWVAHGGGGVSLSPRLSIELLGFLSDNGLPGGEGNRVLLSGDYRFPSGWQITGGGAFGETGISLSRTTEVREGFGTLSLPVGGGHRLSLALRHQALADAEDLTVVSLGITLAFLGG